MVEETTAASTEAEMLKSLVARHRVSAPATGLQSRATRSVSNSKKPSAST
jgi:hypothetical protein